jgi:cyclic pyranopterin phosphate synthase
MGVQKPYKSATNCPVVWFFRYFATLTMLTDRFQRVHDYLRISLTDSCNLRCAYCMPDEHIQCMPHHRLMSAEEIETMARIFVAHGVRKIRLTGGEPLVRKEAREIMERLAPLPVELTLTTNAVLADRFLDVFLQAGVRSLNVSLDTLQPEAFFALTRRDNWHQVWRNLMLLVENGLHVKLNTVVMKGVNEQELPDFVALTRELPIHTRFIEFMPFQGNQWEHERVFPAAEMLELIGARFDFEKLPDAKNDTAKKFKVYGHRGTFAIISTMSAPFCAGCNRMRLTADGKMKNCLFSRSEVDLLGALRNGEDIVPLIRYCLDLKEEALGGQLLPEYDQIDAEKLENRSMIAIGG